MDIISKQDAKSSNKLRYFTGKKCKHGHIAERQVSNSVCVECHKSRNQKFMRNKYQTNDDSYRQSRCDYQKRYRENNPEQYKEMMRNRPGNTDEYKQIVKERSNQHYSNNREHYKIRKRIYHRYKYDNDESYRQKIKQNSKNYRLAHPAWKIAQGAKRRAQKLKATPKWANNKSILNIYEQARMKTEETGNKYHVDHIVPLLGNEVCGLHCEDNLQILIACDNLQKSNIFGGD